MFLSLFVMFIPVSISTSLRKTGIQHFYIFPLFTIAPFNTDISSFLLVLFRHMLHSTTGWAFVVQVHIISCLYSSPSATGRRRELLVKDLGSLLKYLCVILASHFILLTSPFICKMRESKHILSREHSEIIADASTLYLKVLYSLLALPRYFYKKEISKLPNNHNME